MVCGGLKGMAITGEMSRFPRRGRTAQATGQTRKGNPGGRAATQRVSRASRVSHKRRSLRNRLIGSAAQPLRLTCL